MFDVSSDKVSHFGVGDPSIYPWRPQVIKMTVIYINEETLDHHRKSSLTSPPSHYLLYLLPPCAGQHDASQSIMVMSSGSCQSTRVSREPRQAANGLPLNFKWFTQEEWLTCPVEGDACMVISKFCKRTWSASRSAIQTQENRQLRQCKGIN